MQALFFGHVLLQYSLALKQQNAATDPTMNTALCEEIFPLTGNTPPQGSLPFARQSDPCDFESAFILTPESWPLTPSLYSLHSDEFLFSDDTCFKLLQGRFEFAFDFFSQFQFL